MRFVFLFTDINLSQCCIEMLILSVSALLRQLPRSSQNLTDDSSSALYCSLADCSSAFVFQGLWSIRSLSVPPSEVA